MKYISQYNKDNILRIVGDLNNPTPENITIESVGLPAMKIGATDRKFKRGFPNMYIDECDLSNVSLDLENCFCDELLSERAGYWMDNNGINSPAQYRVSYQDVLEGEPIELGTKRASSY